MNDLTPLCEIAFKYGTDKCPQLGHSYTPFYYKLFKDKQNTIKKVLELGVASRETLQWAPDHYQNGASLLMWREFFPNAQIYGVDKNPVTIFQAERVKTILLNTKNEAGLKKLIADIGSDIDLVVDDGAHNERYQVATAKDLLPILDKKCIYVIEDAKNPDSIKKQLSEYDSEVIKFRGRRRDNNLIIVRK